MLSAKQQAALDTLLAGGTGVQAAEKAGVSAALVSRWKKDLPEFRKALSERNDGILADIAAQLTPLLPAATKALRECLEKGNGTVRVRAAGLVLDQLRGVTQEAQLQDRIAELEDLVRELLEGPAGPAPEAGLAPEIIHPPGPGGPGPALPGPDLPDAGGWSQR